MEELIRKIERYVDQDADSEWKYGKNFGLQLALHEIREWEQDEAGNSGRD